MLERIVRVINNHQMSCQNTDRYAYVLRGFETFKNRMKIPLEHYKSEPPTNKNYFIYSEELKDFDKSNFNGYKIIEVMFNFFEDGELFRDGDFVEPFDLGIDTSDVIYIFNRNNALIGVSEKLDLDNLERVDFLIKNLK